MYPAPFEYHRAGSVQEAIGLLQQFGDEAKLIAGGHSLLPVLKLRLAQPGHLIDLAGIGGLTGVREEGGVIRIGALTTHRAIEQDETLRRRAPILSEAAGVIGDRQVRNRGTIGGALAHGDPAADYPAAVLALEAEVVAQGPNGERIIPIGEFFVDLLTTALSPDEVLTEIRVPAPSGQTGSSYQKLANQASGYATVGVAAIVTLNGGVAETVKVGITGAGATAFRASGVETALAGKPLDDATVREAAERAPDGIDLLSDVHASADYRARVVVGLTRRALLTAAQRAG